MKRNILIIIMIMAAFLRLYKLGGVPVSMSDDEIRETMSAYAVWQTGYDVTGSLKYPLSFFLDGYTFTPVPIYLSAPFIGMFGLSMHSARLPYALAAIATIYIVYLLGLRLLKNQKVALLSALSLSISVWHLQMSRFSVETTFALMFYTLGTYLFLGIEEKKTGLHNVMGAMVAFFLAFHSYNATKIIFLPLIILLGLYELKIIIKNKKTLLSIFTATLITVGSFVYLKNTQNAGRHGGQLFIYEDREAAAQAVELKRRESNLPGVLSTVYYNKVTYWMEIFARQYLYAFSPQYLLTDQEASGIYSVRGRGQLYLIEAPLLTLGILFLARHAKRQLSLVLLMLALAPLPSGLSAGPPSYTMRASFMLPWLSLFIGAGISSLVNLTRAKWVKMSLITLVAIIYLYLVTGYLLHYYFDWVRDGAKYYSKGAQDLVKFVAERINNYLSVIITGSPNLALHYLFYTKKPIGLIQKKYQSKQIYLENVQIHASCLIDGGDPKKILLPKTLYIAFPSCHPLGKPDSKIKSFDGQDLWYVFVSD